MGSWRFPSVALAVVVLAGCSAIDFAGNRIDGSGVVETRTFQVGDFDRVEIGSAFHADVTVTSQTTSSVEVEADDNFFEHITIEVRDSTLEAQTSGNVDLDGEPVLITVTTPNLKSVTLSGATTVTVRAAGTDVPDFEVSGASRLHVLDLDSSDINLEVSGASRAIIDGVGADTADVEVSGASSAELSGLPLRSARVDVSGASTVDFGPAEIVAGSASGASNVLVDADTTLDVETSGSSSARRR